MMPVRLSQGGPLRPEFPGHFTLDQKTLSQARDHATTSELPPQ